MTMTTNLRETETLAGANPDERERQIERILAMADSPQRRALEPKDFSEGMELAKVYANAGLYGISDSNTAFVILQTGRELGLMAGQSFRALYVVDGKPALYAAAKVALARRSGLCTKWNVLESTADKCVIEVQRNGDAPVVFEWTRARADAIYLDKDRKQRLTDKAVWKNFPIQMLRHRAESEAVDALFQDVTLGLGTVEELEHEGPPRSETVDLAPKSTPKPAANTAPAPTTPTDAAGVWVAKFAAVASQPPVNADASQKELEALVASVPASFRPACKDALKKAKERIAAARQPEGDGPKGGGTPKPEAPTNTTAVAEREPGSDDGDGATAWTPARWAAHLAPKSSPHEVINSHAKHVAEFGLSDEFRAVTVSRLVALGHSPMQAVNALTARVAARKAA